MDSKLLINLCDNYQDSDDQFKVIVNSFCEKQENIKLLSIEFEVAASTVARWRNGVAQPHSRMQKEIVNYIKNNLAT